MKKLLVIAIALASTSAFASRARVTSLGNSAHIIDTQTIYSNPARMFSMGDFVSLESGATATSTNPSASNSNGNAEGLLVRSMGDSKMGLALGHKSENASGFGLRSALGAGRVTEQQNPVEFSYGMKSGDVAWAGTLVYSNYNNKTPNANVKESSMGLRLGALTGAWDFNAGIGLGNKVEDQVNNLDFKGTTGVSLYAGYTMDSMYYYGEISLAGAKSASQTTGVEQHKVEQTKITLGAVESVKKDGNEFFYGAKLVSTMFKDDVTTATTDDVKRNSLVLPVIVGLEAEATSWMTLRGSLTQNVLLSNSKTETGSATTAETAPGLNTTVASIGAGLKFNKVTIDGSLEGLTGGTANQQVDGDTLLSTVGLTYMF